MKVSVLCAVLMFTCCLSGCMALEPMMVLVNRQPVMAGNKDLDVFVRYSYVDGEMVDVSCIFMIAMGKVTMEYMYIQKPLVDYDYSASKGDLRWAERAVGLQMTLLKRHNSTKLTCDFEVDGVSRVRVTLTFVLKELIGDYFKIEVNDLWFVRENVSNLIQYYYKENELLVMTCERKDDGLWTVLTSEWSEKVKQSSCRISIDPAKQTQVKYQAVRKFGIMSIHMVQFHFIQLPTFPDYDEPLLLLHLPRKVNILLKSYRWNGDILYYYQYQDGDVLNLECVRYNLKTERNGHEYILNFGGELESKYHLIVKRIKLNSADDGQKHICSLLNNNNITLRQICVVFERRPASFTATTIRTTSSTKAQHNRTNSRLKKRMRSLPSLDRARSNPIGNSSKPLYIPRLDTNTSTVTDSTSDAPTSELSVIAYAHDPGRSYQGLAVIIGGILAIIIVVIVVILICRRKRKEITVNNANDLLIADNRPSPLGAVQPDNSSSVEYAYAYEASGEAISAMPNITCKTYVQQTPESSEYSSAPVYDYAYARSAAFAPQTRSNCDGQSALHTRDSLNSDYTDHYTEIDEYFIKKQREERLLRQLKRRQNL